MTQNSETGTIELPPMLRVKALRLPEGYKVIARIGIGTHRRTIKPGDHVLRGDQLMLERETGELEQPAAQNLVC